MPPPEQQMPIRCSPDGGGSQDGRSSGRGGLTLTMPGSARRSRSLLPDAGLPGGAELPDAGLVGGGGADVSMATYFAKPGKPEAEGVT